MWAIYLILVIYTTESSLSTDVRPLERPELNQVYNYAGLAGIPKLYILQDNVSD